MSSFVELAESNDSMNALSDLKCISRNRIIAVVLLLWACDVAIWISIGFCCGNTIDDTTKTQEQFVHAFSFVAIMLYLLNRQIFSLAGIAFPQLLGIKGKQQILRQLRIGILSFFAGIAVIAVPITFAFLFKLSELPNWGSSSFTDLVWLSRRHPSLAVIIESYLIACVLVPIMEEFLHRGLLFGWLRVRHSFWVAALASGFIFACCHGNLLGLLPYTVIGIAFAFVYEKSRGLLAPIILHSLWNLIALLAHQFRL